MLILFFASVFLNGILLTKLLFKKPKTLFFWAGSFILGSLVSAEFVYVLYFLFSKFSNPLFLSVSVFIIISFLAAFFKRKDFKEIPLALGKLEILFLILILLFSGYIFFRSFSYDSYPGLFLISSNSYLDFGAHLPIIRFFSLGQNHAGFLPFLGGRPIIYHYLFDFYTAILENLGVRIDWAFNLISALSLTSLLIMVYSFSLKLFKLTSAAVLSVILVLFNGALTFIIFLQNNPLNGQFLTKLRNYNIYLDNGPFGQSPVGIFWNLNTYLNQRHLVFAMAFLFWLLIWVLEQDRKLHLKKSLTVGLLIGLLPFWHIEIFLMALVLVSAMYVLHKNLKLVSAILLASLIVALPQIILIRLTSHNQIVWHPGFLAEKPTWENIFSYWVWNLGFYFLTVAAAFFVLRGKAKKLFIISFLFFLIPNFFQFGQEIFNNHKFFNVWIIFMAVFVSYFILCLFQKNLLGKILSVVLTVLLTASGFLSLLVVKNDVYAKIPDYPNSNFMQWLIKNTNPHDLFLTNGDIYDPVNLAGRQTFLGKEYYVWAYGGDILEAVKEQNEVLNCISRVECFNILKRHNISHIVIYMSGRGTETKNITINKNFFNNNFKKVYEDDKTAVYKI